MNIVSKFSSLVKFSHTIFAMPFAMIGFSLGVVDRTEVFDTQELALLLVKVILCMIFARNTAMAFNRWADRKIDALNPRTADRDIPSGVVTPRNAMIFIVANALLFVATTSTINTLCFALSPVAIGVIIAYSYCKRFTSLAHIVLGLSLGIAPVGSYIAVTGGFDWSVITLSMVVLSWCAGFDIIYALQDAEFDRAHGLHSIPSRFSVRGALYISIALHCITTTSLIAFAMQLPSTMWLWSGVAIFVLLLILQHILVTPSRQRHIGIAFGTLNGIASIVLAVGVILSLLL